MAAQLPVVTAEARREGVANTEVIAVLDAMKTLQHGIAVDTQRLGSGWEIGAGQEAFQAGVLDGRQTLANIVGICNTFLPWQLMEREEVVHSYPHCWRCRSKLIYYARDSWFVRTTAYRDRMLARNARVNGIYVGPRDDFERMNALAQCR